MEPKIFSRKLLQRLRLYLNYLKALPEGTLNVSAVELAKALGLGQALLDDAGLAEAGFRVMSGFDIAPSVDLPDNK
jgi:NADH/NAD ratio-sensing transcriptional regulator Rex